MPRGDAPTCPAPGSWPRGAAPRHCPARSRRAAPRQRRVTARPPEITATTSGPGAGRRGRAAGADDAEETLERGLDLLAPGEHRPEVHAASAGAAGAAGRSGSRPAGGTRRAGRSRAVGSPTTAMHSTARMPPWRSEVLDHHLHEHATEAGALVLLEDLGGRELDGVLAKRRRGVGRGAGEAGRRGVEHEAGGLVVDVGHPAARAPLEQDRGDPGLLLGHRRAGTLDPGPLDGVELPLQAAADVSGRSARVSTVSRDRRRAIR